MSFTKRMKTVAGATVAGAAISAATMVGFAGTANAADYEFRLCNSSTKYNLTAEFEDGSTSRKVFPGDCVKTGGVAADTDFQLFFDLAGEDNDKRSRVLNTFSDGHTQVETDDSLRWTMSKY
ncbi:hypothetical protein CFN78_20125 [Amycolatopsis antarctica]|uniref:Uncharacterized protein n=1 Tax=Amycolatopsis antarctica TaxID=1854586 RepID=A0A263D1F0_9PSEU|nr:hypothetical protein [Amycolatopsis antarctica]OZM71457.1 hypothetical protein CFN78_20125 [Amycolatopsis antarctica]